jgi:V-type H+-transporting ATPase subunit E
MKDYFKARIFILTSISQAKIVRQESLNIEAVFERKIKQAEVQKRM